MLSETVAASYS